MAGIAISLLYAPATAGATLAFVAASKASATATSLSITKPTGLASGEVELATVAGTGTATSTAPSGWTAIQDDLSGSSTLRTTSYYHVAGSSEPTSYSFSFSASRTAVGGISAYSGEDTAIPVDVSAAATGSSGNSVAASVTTTAPSEWVVVPAAFTGVLSFVADATTAQRWSLGSSTTIDGDSADFTQSTAGATATKTNTATGDTGWAMHTIGLRPSGASGVLTVSPSTPSPFSATLSGSNQTVTYTLPITVTDTTGANAGWDVTITSTQLTTGSHTLPSTASNVTAASAACLSGSSCTSPTNSIAYPLAVPAGATAPTAVKLFNAATGSGLGHNLVTPTVQVAVPANAYTGSYASTVTLAAASGP